MTLAADEADIPLGHDPASAHGGRLVLLTPCRDLSDVRTILCGHSQAWAICHATVQPSDRGIPSPGSGIARAYGIGGLAGPANKDDSYFAVAARLSRSRDLAVTWNGNQPNVDFLLALDPPLDFVPRSQQECVLDPLALLVPESAVRAHFAPSLVKLEALLEAVGHPPGCRRFVLGTPAPLHDCDLVRSRLVREPTFADQVRRLGGDIAVVAITPGAIRRKFWQVLQELMAELAARHGATFVPTPRATLDEYGCLHPHYSLGDATHCNLGYGIHALRDLVGYLQ